MPPSRRQQVWDRAGRCCEYCQMPQEFDVLPFQLDHIRAQKHGGPTTIANLALACLPCRRATIEVLGINTTDRIQHRRLLIQARVFPPLRP